MSGSLTPSSWAEWRGIPSPPPGPVESEVYVREMSKIFDVKELTGKIFRTKHLALAVLVFEEHARRVRFTY
jgi:hypothetical protein